MPCACQWTLGLVYLNITIKVDLCNLYLNGPRLNIEQEAFHFTGVRNLDLWLKVAIEPEGIVLYTRNFVTVFCLFVCFLISRLQSRNLASSNGDLDTVGISVCVPHKAIQCWCWKSNRWHTKGLGSSVPNATKSLSILSQGKNNTALWPELH